MEKVELQAEGVKIAGCTRDRFDKEWRKK